MSEAGREALGDKVFPIGISYLDEFTCGVYPTDLVLVGAETGIGKTTLISMIAERATRAGRRPFVFALEAETGEIEQRKLYQEIADLAWRGEHPRRRELRYPAWRANRCTWADEFLEEALEATEKRLSGMTTFYRSKDFTEDDVDRLMRKHEGDADLFILDHVHYIDFDNPNENAALKQIIKTIRDTVLCIKKPVICVAHLRKPDRRAKLLVPTVQDFMGSSDLPKIATKCVLMAPGSNEGGPPHLSPTYMHVSKDRAASRCKFVAELQFDTRTWRYSNNYTLGRLIKGGTEFERLTPPELPMWADSAIHLKAEDI